MALSRAWTRAAAKYEGESERSTNPLNHRSR